MSETSEQYIERILSYQEGKRPLGVLSSTPKKLQALLGKRSSSLLQKRPSPGQWSAAEIIAHMADSELVLSYRLRLVLATDGAQIQAFNQDTWANTFEYAKHDARQSLELFRIVRESNLRLLRRIPKERWENHGIHDERGHETVTQMTRLFAGHDINHVRQIQRLIGRKKK